MNERLINFRRWMLPLFLTGILLLVQLIFSPVKLQDAVTLAPVTDFHLNYPLIYLVFEPIFGLADALTLGVLWQTVIFILCFIASLLFVKGWGMRFFLFSAFMLFTAWAVLIPRPMAWITADDPENLVVDFHSHTQTSHDGRAFFTMEANAQWHRQQGFNASFLTNHKSVTPTKSSFSLAGEEVSLYKMSFIVLSPKTSVDSRPYSSDPSLIEPFIKEMHERGLLVIGVLPYYWMNYWTGQPNVEDFIRWGIDGFEISNGHPRGMNFPFQDRQKLLALCRKYNLIFNGVSDNHGYGSAAPCWSVVRLPGWRSLSTSELEATIVTHLAKNRFSAVRVLERPRFRPANRFELAFSPIGIAFVYARSLSWPQTISWVLWIWCLTFLLEFLKLRRNLRRAAVSVPAGEIA